MYKVHLQAIRSKPLIKSSPPQRPKKTVHDPADLDFGYLEDMNKQKMFMLIRMGKYKPNTETKYVYTNETIPTLPIRNRTQSPQYRTIKIPKRKDSSPNPESTVRVLHEHKFDDPYQMEVTKHKVLDHKLRYVNKINRRVLDKFII